MFVGGGHVAWFRQGIDRRLVSSSSRIILGSRFELILLLKKCCIWAVVC